MTIAADLTSLYRSRLSNLTAGLHARLAIAWALLWTPDSPAESLAALGGVTAAWTAAAQRAALLETQRWLQALLAAAGINPTGLVVPGGAIGTSASGRSLQTLLADTPAVFFARLGAGAGRDGAAQAALAWLNRIAGSEPYRAANGATVHVAQNDPRFTGRVGRNTRPGCCQFCETIRDRGYVPAHAGFQAHANCRCTASPEIIRHVRKRRP